MFFPQALSFLLANTDHTLRRSPTFFRFFFSEHFTVAVCDRAERPFGRGAAVSACQRLYFRYGQKPGGDSSSSSLSLLQSEREGVCTALRAALSCFGMAWHASRCGTVFLGWLYGAYTEQLGGDGHCQRVGINVRIALRVTPG